MSVDQLMQLAIEFANRVAAGYGATEPRDALHDALEKLAGEYEEANNYLKYLLPVISPGIQLLPDLAGMCTQIDHLYAGMRNDRDRLQLENEGLKARLAGGEK